MKKITEHEGKKYLREIRSCLTGEKIQVDVYDVIRAFGVTCPAQAHAIKKLLSAGKRGKGSELDDLIGADAAISRAIEECRKDGEEVQKMVNDLIQRVKPTKLSIPQEDDPRYKIEFGLDGLCKCDCGTECPLGKMGMEEKCRFEEVFPKRSMNNEP